MTDAINPTDAIQQAVAIAGSQTALAELIGVTQGLIHHYLRGVKPPPDRCVAVEQSTGIRCELLRPDITWTRREDGQITGYHVPLSLPGPKAEQQPSVTGALSN